MEEDDRIIKKYNIEQVLRSTGRPKKGGRPHFSPIFLFTPLRSVHPRITGLMRKFARLANFPNFFRFAPETSHKPDVVRNSTSIHCVQCARLQRCCAPRSSAHQRLCKIYFRKQSFRCILCINARIIFNSQPATKLIL